MAFKIIIKYNIIFIISEKRFAYSYIKSFFFIIIHEYSNVEDVQKTSTRKNGADDEQPHDNQYVLTTSSQCDFAIAWSVQTMNKFISLD